MEGRVWGFGGGGSERVGGRRLLGVGGGRESEVGVGEGTKRRVDDVEV